MAEVIHDDVVEQILIQLDVKDLIRYKSVCKSWHSLITSPRFINRHLNHSCNKDHYNNQLANRRITLFERSGLGNHLVGSSNGLVCIFSNSIHLRVTNPLTREVRQLESPRLIGVLQLCWGFGYDSSREGYKVVIGTKKGENQTCFEVLSLKSNVWRVIGEVKYTFITKAGILCNGALHWIVKDQNNKKLIISYDLSKEEFKEIPLPVNAICRRLGVIKNCLCIFGYYSVDNVWLMKKYNVKESWELLPRERDREMKNHIVHLLRPRLPKDDDASWFCHPIKHLYWEYMDAPIFVQSLVSPHSKE
ncbi:putative F-box domain, galactose oxidase/kelch, beta-propeller, F-box associated interaction [Helianthus debilis subsp. tardiflorus]